MTFLFSPGPDVETLRLLVLVPDGLFGVVLFMIKLYPNLTPFLRVSLFE